MSILSKAKTMIWYLSRPKYYSQIPNLLKQRLAGAKTENTAAESVAWCSTLAVDTGEALYRLTGKKEYESIRERYKEIFAGAEQREQSCPVKMGGAGNLDLLYYLSEHVAAKEVIETGVAYGWSSLALLLSLTKRDGQLHSVDMPYAKMGNENFVGIVVPGNLKSKWELIRLPDRKGLKIALGNVKSLDLCHYDSDKSYAGRMFAYPLLWGALRPGGIFISDDIQDNLGFHDFCKKDQLEPVIVDFNGKYIGIIRK